MKYILRMDLPTIQLTDGRTLYQIQRLSDMVLGGYVEKESNLSQDGSCWIADQAWVYGYAMVTDDAQVYEQAVVFGNAHIRQQSKVYGTSIVCGFADISGQAEIGGNAVIRFTESVGEKNKQFTNTNLQAVHSDYSNYRNIIKLP